MEVDSDTWIDVSLSTNACVHPRPRLRFLLDSTRRVYLCTPPMPPCNAMHHRSSASSSPRGGRIWSSSTRGARRRPRPSWAATWTWCVLWEVAYIHGAVCLVLLWLGRVDSIHGPACLKASAGSVRHTHEATRLPFSLHPPSRTCVCMST